jgi:hypothetical protein
MVMKVSAKQCNAKAKSTQERCNNPAVNGYDVCRLHGGKTPRGILNGNTKHGRYSKDLPTRLAGRFEDAINDSELGTLKSEIALLDTRIGEMLSNVDTEQYGDIWQRTHDGFHKLKAAINSKDGSLMATALNDMDACIRAGYSDMSTWDNVVKLVEQRRKLTDSERKRLVDLQQMITAEQSILLVGALMRAVKTHVTDKNALSAIANEIRSITG